MSRKKIPIRKNNDVIASGDGDVVLPNGAPVSPELEKFVELGATGLRRYGGFIYEEFLQELVGWQGQAVFKEMSKNDATCGAILFAIKMLCRRVKWFVEPGDSKPEDLKAATFVETCMGDMSQPWVETIDSILSMLPCGYSAHELVYKVRKGPNNPNSMFRSNYDDGKIGWKRIPIRAQDTIYRWIFDENGSIKGYEQLPPPAYQAVFIPIEKTLLFRTNTDRNNPEGTSILRTAYRSWYMKKNIENIEAIGVERDLAGLPIAFVPPEMLSENASQNQKSILANITNLVVNIRRNAQEGLVFPLDYNDEGKVRFDLKLLSTGGARQFNTSEIINRYDHRIAMTVLADFIFLGQEKVGSFALASSKTNLFATAIGGYLDIVADVFNRYAIPRLCAVNGMKLKRYPEIKHGDLGSVDLEVLGKYIQSLAQAGMPLFPNPEVEKHFLEVAGLPTANFQAMREQAVQKPQPGVQKPGDSKVNAAQPQNPAPPPPPPSSAAEMAASKKPGAETSVAKPGKGNS